jgi:hypothetical protein
VVLDIRPGSAADAAEIRQMRRETWIAACVAPSGGRRGPAARNILTGLGGVLELRYARDL